VLAKNEIARPLWIKITGCGFLAVLLASTVIGGLGWYRQSELTQHSLEFQSRSDGEFIQADMESQGRAASALALGIAGEPDIASLMERDAREELIQRYHRNFAAIKTDGDLHLLTFTTAAGKALARVHNPKTFGDDVTARRRMGLEAVRTRKLAVGIEPGLEALSVFGTAPVFKDRDVIGVVDVGTALGKSYFDRLKSKLKADIAVQMFDGTGFKTQTSTFSGPTQLTQEELKSAFDGADVRRVADIGQGSFVLSAFPVKDFSGKKVGVIEIASDLTTLIQQGRSALWQSLFVSVGVSLGALILFFLFARAIGFAIRSVTNTMSRLAGGDLNVEVKGQDRPDEIGAMARAVEVFKANGLALDENQREVATQRRNAEQERTRNEAAREASAKEQAFVVSSIGEGLEHLATGDLTFRLRDDFPGEYRTLQDNFNGAMETLQDTMKTIAGATEGIRSGTGEVSQAADDLSKRTEQQAASLEETAAALDEITATVRKTAEGANHARDVVSTAKADAERSGEIVGGAVQAMAEIDKSSKQISNIIGVIDEIAFQTNLLALNAGVEAARAGEAGKGFAVVASEVRALAQRSADAAKEIKALIQASSTQVGSGVDLVGQAGKALARIAEQVADINGVVLEIAASAKEQATGLAEVNTAVNQMDQVTQQNAAMVEQSTAASHSLAQEAEELGRLIARFKVGGDSPTAAPAPAPKRQNPAQRAVAVLKSVGGRGVSAARKAEPAEESWEEF
jgi:methyl-accepting chemotaxis protein